MSDNISHYNIELLPAELKAKVADHKLNGPAFIGQGLTSCSGSDSYGYYITGMKLIKNKIVIGISRANAVMANGWEDGTMNCSIDMDNATPDFWITSYGKTKYNGLPKWWRCNADGVRMPGCRAIFSWNGAHQYRDPSF